MGEQTVTINGRVYTLHAERCIDRAPYNPGSSIGGGAFLPTDTWWYYGDDGGALWATPRTNDFLNRIAELETEVESAEFNAQEVDDIADSQADRITELEADNARLEKIRSLLVAAAKTQTEWDFAVGSDGGLVHGSEAWTTWMPPELWDLLQCPTCGGSGAAGDAGIAEYSMDIGGRVDETDCPDCDGHGLAGDNND